MYPRSPKTIFGTTQVKEMSFPPKDCCKNGRLDCQGVYMHFHVLRHSPTGFVRDIPAMTRTRPTTRPLQWSRRATAEALRGFDRSRKGRALRSVGRDGSSKKIEHMNRTLRNKKRNRGENNTTNMGKTRTKTWKSINNRPLSRGKIESEQCSSFCYPNPSDSKG